MDPIVTYGFVFGIFSVVVLIAIAVGRYKPQAQVAVEKAVEATAVETFALLQRDIATQQQAIAAAQAALAATQARFAAAKAAVAAMS